MTAPDSSARPLAGRPTAPAAGGSLLRRVVGPELFVQARALQARRGLVVDPRGRRFYETCGVV